MGLLLGSTGCQTSQSQYHSTLTTSSALLPSFSLTACSLASSLSAGIQPLTREPSAKNTAGVPCTPSPIPNLSKSSMGVSQLTSAGACSLVIQSDHAWAGSSAHQTCSARVREAGVKKGNNRV